MEEEKQEVSTENNWKEEKKMIPPSASVSAKYLQGSIHRSIIQPNSWQQYNKIIEKGLQFNKKANTLRKRSLKRQWTILNHGYSHVLDTSKRSEQLPYSKPRPNNKVASALTSSQKMSHNLNEKLNGAKINKTSSLEPQHQQTTTNISQFEQGSWVTIQKSSELHICGGLHLIGKTGRVAMVPTVPGQSLYGILFQDNQALQYVPLSSLQLISQPTTSSSSTNFHFLNKSYEMQNLMTRQYKEIQEMQLKHSQNPSVDVHKEMTNLRGKHLLQLQQLQQKASQ